jgi:hypothetical protein
MRGKIIEEQRIFNEYSKEHLSKLLGIQIKEYDKLIVNKLEITKELEQKISIVLNCPISFLNGITTSMANKELVISIKEDLDRLNSNELSVLHGIIHSFVELQHKNDPNSETTIPLNESIKEANKDESLFLKKSLGLIQTLRLR